MSNPVISELEKKPLQAQQSAESEGEEGNLNNSDTNGNDIINQHIFLSIT